LVFLLSCPAQPGISRHLIGTGDIEKALNFVSVLFSRAAVNAAAQKGESALAVARCRSAS
jgi:hypothetical protein